MDLEFNTRKKLHAILAQISQLLLSDFPHASSQTALEAMQVYFRTQVGRLDRATKTSNQKVVAQACITINERIYQYLPILGFLLRSTNVRNNFEAYHSFLTMARAIIGPRAKVVISSEWDFSPLTYPLTVSALPDYVLLGMPSSESSNALILPLAGHELGHSVWKNEQLENKYASVVQEKAEEHLTKNWVPFQRTFTEFVHLNPTKQEFSTNIALVDVISDIVRLGLSQLEETFCDGIGAHLFGASYIFAFHYLLAPNLGGIRSLEYPALTVRADHLSRFGGLSTQSLGFSHFAAEFQDRLPNLSPRDGFISLAADEIAKVLANEVYQDAQKIVQSKARHLAHDDAAQAEILRMFSHNVPARLPRSMPDVLNAGWQYVKANASTFPEDERSLFDWVSELILKSLEVLEYRDRVGNA
jgi:hypothetical protein